ncbi:phospholipid scramblase-related protein [Candidatus Haliotispira prima]|uniref:Phospholipid scramblase-related protein n=1 Tax=Candidatus Haliotispira prima TaxID=3034016 RepID=A0ABY8MJN7_9SPIO|nr:phospholipid scramblase-related protein [Candidatus Haliotispira prima]
MLDRKAYFIRENAGVHTYDIIDPESSEQIGIAKQVEPETGLWGRLLASNTYDAVLPNKVYVYEGNDPTNESKLSFSIHKRLTFFKARADIHDHTGTAVGYLKSQFPPLGGPGYDVFDTQDNIIAFVESDFKFSHFSFKNKADQEIGTISKKWTGIKQELFTSADNYMLSLNDNNSPKKAMILLAATFAIDIIHYNKDW